MTNSKSKQGKNALEELIDTEYGGDQQLQQSAATEEEEQDSTQALAKSETVTPQEAAMLDAFTLGIPYIDLTMHQIQPEALRLIPESMARKHKAIPLAIIDNSLHVAMAKPDDVLALEALNKNPVLSEMGVFLTMRLLLYRDITSNEKANTESFVKWAEHYADSFPEPGLLADLALAYGFLGDDKNAKRIIDKAVSIYSRNDFLLERQRHVYAGTIVELFKNTQVRNNDEAK